MLARLNARLPDGLGWDKCLEKGLGGELGRSACGVACEVARRPGLGLVLGNCLGSMHGKSAGKVCFVCFNTKSIGMSNWKVVR